MLLMEILLTIGFCRVGRWSLVNDLITTHFNGSFWLTWWEETVKAHRPDE